MEVFVKVTVAGAKELLSTVYVKRGTVLAGGTGKSSFLQLQLDPETL